MFKIVAFDMDGTIADTIPMCITAFRNSVSPYTDHELSSEEILHTFGINFSLYGYFGLDRRTKFQFIPILQQKLIDLIIFGF